MDFEQPSLLERVVENLTRYVLAPHVHGRFVRNLQLKGGEHVLELGCGGGMMTRFLCDTLTDGTVAGIDTSRYWTDVARKRMSGRRNAQIICGDVRELPLEPGSQDVEIVHLVLHDIPSVERQSIIDALATALAGNGRLHIKEPTRESHGMSVEEIHDLCACAGLRELRREYSSSIFTGPLYYGVYGH